LLAICHLGRPIGAHGETIESSPSPGEVLSKAPEAVEIVLSSALADESLIQVLDAGFERVDQGGTQLLSGSGRSMRVDLKPDLPPGGYTVQWLAVDRDDGHQTRGSFAFEVVEDGMDWGSGAAMLAALLLVALLLRALKRAATPPAPLAGVVLLLTLSFGLAACGSPVPGAGRTAPDSPSTGEPSDGTRAIPMQVAIASTDLAVGPERFAFGLMDGDAAIIPDAEAELQFFWIGPDGPTPADHVRAHWYPSSLAGAGIYVARTDFDRAGVWGVEIAVRLPDGRRPPTQRIRFTVAQVSAAPAVGERAPPTKNPILDDVVDVAEITSDPDPDLDLYRLTVDAAVANEKPSLVVFATPGYCQTRLCSPVLDEIKALGPDWGQRLNRIHIEVYRDFEKRELAPEMEDWGLVTEPWVFLLDAQGRVADRLEGSVTRAELEPILKRLFDES
jgi:methionine-rich copper-binding protein CopC